MPPDVWPKLVSCFKRPGIGNPLGTLLWLNWDLSCYVKTGTKALDADVFAWGCVSITGERTILAWGGWRQTQTCFNPGTGQLQIPPPTPPRRSAPAPGSSESSCLQPAERPEGPLPPSSGSKAWGEAGPLGTSFRVLAWTLTPNQNKGCSHGERLFWGRS